MSPIGMGWIAARSMNRVQRSVEARSASRARFGILWIALVGLLAGAPAFGHSGPDLLFPESDYTVKWYQPHSEPAAEEWDVEVNPVDGSGRYVMAAQAMPDDSCWSLNVPIDQPAFIRMRSVSGEQVSNWTPVTSVPEPGFALASFLGVGLLSALASKRGRTAGRDRKAGSEARSKRRSAAGPSAGSDGPRRPDLKR